MRSEIRLQANDNGTDRVAVNCGDEGFAHCCYFFGKIDQKIGGVCRDKIKPLQLFDVGAS